MNYIRLVIIINLSIIYHRYLELEKDYKFIFYIYIILFFYYVYAIFNSKNSIDLVLREIKYPYFVIQSAIYLFSI